MQRARADNLVLFKTNQRQFLSVSPVIDNEFRHNIVKVRIHSYFDNVMTKCMINNWTDNAKLTLICYNEDQRQKKNYVP